MNNEYSKLNSTLLSTTTTVLQQSTSTPTVEQQMSDEYSTSTVPCIGLIAASCSLLNSNYNLKLNN